MNFSDTVEHLLILGKKEVLREGPIILGHWLSKSTTTNGIQIHTDSELNIQIAIYPKKSDRWPFDVRTVALFYFSGLLSIIIIFM